VARTLLRELKRRNVLRVVVGYIVLVWLMSQVADLVLEAFGAPDWVMKSLLALFLIGLPFVAYFAWAFELTPEGVKREREVDREQSITGQTGRRLDRTIIVLLLLALAWFAWDRYQPVDVKLPEASVAEQELTDNDPNAASDEVLPIVAVLPFKAEGSDDGGFLAAGLHDDLLTRLVKLTAFRVISRTSMMEYANTTKNMRQIGQELGADYILEGGVQARGDQVRINAQLIDAPKDQHIWAEIYNRELTASNLFNIQAELAVAIANAMQTKLSSADRALVDELPTQNLEAYNAYLRGIRLFMTTKYVGTQTDRDAKAAFEEAVTRDPGFALAWALLATARIRADCCDYGREQRDSVLAALERARALQPGLLEAELAWAEYQYRFLKQYEEALSALEALGDRIAGDIYALSLKAWLHRRLGRYQAGYEILQAAQRLEPLNPSIYMDLATFAWQSNDCAAAKQHIGTLLTLAPEVPATRVTVATFELECTGNAVNAANLLRDVDFREVGGWDIAAFAAWKARDTQMALALEENRSTSDWQTAVWRQLDLATIYRYLDPNELLSRQALGEAAGLLTECGNDADLEPMATFALMRSNFYALSGDAAQTRLWNVEHKRRHRAENKGDQFEEAENRFWYAWNYALAGLGDEAVAELRAMLEEPGGHRFPFVDDAPAFDAIRDDPGYLALRDRFGHQTVR